jgi:hypothetical protein
MNGRSPHPLPLLAAFALAALMMLALSPAPAAASNGGCCIYNGMCTTTTEGQCKRVAQAGGHGYIFNRNMACSGTTCKAGSSCFMCQGGASAGDACELSEDCGDDGLCVGTIEDADADPADIVILDALNRTDTDHDGRTDFLDNCPFHANPDQADSDKDGFGDRCPVGPYTIIGLPAGRRGLPALTAGERPGPR